MKNRSNVFLGALLVAFGFLFLAFNYDLLDFSFRQIARFWPLLIVIGGVAVLIHPRKTFFNTVTALCIAFAIPLGIYTGASSKVDIVKENFDDNFDFDFDEDEDYSYNEKEEGNSGELITQDYSVDLKSGIENAKLTFGGGAAEFHLSESSSKLFEAKTVLSNGSYKLSEEFSGATHDIDFEMKSKNKDNNFSINDDFDLKNDVYLKLNKTPVWDITVKVGAGDLNFDLTEYKLAKLKVETGAASIDLKIGDKFEKLDIDVASGAAKVRLNIPKNVGCRIDIDGILNSKDFEGFTKRGGKYVTDNYDTADKTIEIEMDSAVSSLEVDRY